MREDCFIISYVNIRWLANKLDIVRDILNTYNYHVFIISETWLNEDFASNNLSIAGYKFLRRDRSTWGDGVGIYIKNNINIKILPISNSIEQLWVNITISNKTYYVGVVYRPPNLDHNFFLTELENIFAYDLISTDFIFCLGDINIDVPNREYYNYCD